MNTLLLDGCYLAAAILFILGLKGLNSPNTARRGLVLAEIGMLLAIIGTLLRGDIVQFQWILVGRHDRLGNWRSNGDLHAHDRNASADRHLARLRSTGGNPRGYRRICRTCAAYCGSRDDRSWVRGAARLADRDRQPDGVRQATRTGLQRASDLPLSEHRDDLAARSSRLVSLAT